MNWLVIIIAFLFSIIFLVLIRIIVEQRKQCCSDSHGLRHVFSDIESQPFQLRQQVRVKHLGEPVSVRGEILFVRQVDEKTIDVILDSPEARICFEIDALKNPALNRMPRGTNVLVEGVISELGSSEVHIKDSKVLLIEPFSSVTDYPEES